MGFYWHLCNVLGITNSFIFYCSIIKLININTDWSLILEIDTFEMFNFKNYVWKCNK